MDIITPISKKSSLSLPISKNLRLHIVPQWSLEHSSFAFVIYDKNDKAMAPDDFKDDKLLSDLINRTAKNNKSELLRHILSYTNHITHITLRLGQETLSLTWNEREVWPTTELTIVNDQINVRCKAIGYGGHFIEDIILLNDYFIVDVARKILLPLPQIPAWEWANNVMQYIQYYLYRIPEYYNTQEFHRACDSNQHHSWLHRKEGFLPLTPEMFNANMPITYDTDAELEALGKLFLLKHHDKPATLLPASVRHVIHGILDEKGETITLKPTITNTEIDEWLWHPFIAATLWMNQLDSWLKTKGRTAIIVQTLVDILGIKVPKEAEKLYKQRTKELKASYPNPKTVAIDGINSLFEHYCTMVFTQHNRIMAGKDAFYYLFINSPILLRSLPLINKVYPEATILSSPQEHVRLTLPVKTFYQSFAEFNKLITKERIDFYLNGRKVETMSLNVDFEVHNNQHGGWFDLEPHIMADGLVLSPEQREVLFNGVEQLETADCIKILDEASRLIVRTLAKIFAFEGSLKPTAFDERAIMQIPKLRILDLLELRQAGAQVRLPKEDEELIQRLTNFSKIIPVSLPRHFKGELRKYQKDGYQWLAFLYAHNFGACLADDMGLGKTIQAIAFLAGIHEGIIKRSNAQNVTLPHLIVLPPTLLFNWQAELEKFYPAFRIIEYNGQDQKVLEKYHIVLSTYDRVRIHIETLKKMQFHVALFDEAQLIKNIHSARAASARQIKSLFTVTLTGTPLENHIGEYHSIIDLALPGLLPDYRSFMRYTSKGEHEFFIKKTRAFILRRTKNEIIKDLPPKTESNIMLPMDERQQKIYATTTLEVKRAIEAAYDSHTSAQANIIALTALLRLRQICVSPKIIDPNYDTISPKLEYLVRTLDELNSEGNSALVFSQFTTCLNLIEELLKEEKIHYFRIDGSTPMAQRKKIIETFQNGTQSAVLLLSLKTGGVGLNLTRANYVFHVDIWWNPAVENQATDRSHRIGQKNKVFIQRLIMNSTVEEKVLALQQKKQKLFDDVINNAQNKQKGTITKKDLDFLLNNS